MTGAGSVAQPASPSRASGPSGPSAPSGPPVPPRVRGGSKRRWLAPAIGLVVLALLLAGAGAVYFSHKSAAQDVGDGRGGQAATPSKGPETVLSVTPADGTTGVNGAAEIKVVFSAPLSPTSPMPTLRPSIAGTWQRSGSAAVFLPARGFRPRTKVTLQIPGGSAGVQSTGGGVLAAPDTVKFQTGKLSRVRMEQLLAQLGYLPLTWAPLTGTPAPLSNPNAQLSAAYSPPQGSYTWQPGYPKQLARLWRADAPSEILRGAVIAFEADHGLALDGVIGPGVWHAMFRALSKDQMNRHGYTYALATQKLPEHLTVWHNGKVIFRNLANTGISIRPTAVGTDPVYLRYRYQIMKGRNPDGSKYADPVWWVAYFHYGEAIHYFPRGSYGWPQSLGCVELPYAPAKRIWPYLTFGTLVTVTPP
jgi:peptidoglycan hydrolase-like protein with peptidoglycan-binding domain